MFIHHGLGRKGGANVKRNEEGKVFHKERFNQVQTNIQLKGFDFKKKDSNEVVSFKVLNWSLPIAAESLGRFVRQLMLY